MIRYNAPPLRVEPGAIVEEPRNGTGIVFETYDNGYSYVSFDNGAAVTVPNFSVQPTAFIAI